MKTDIRQRIKIFLNSKNITNRTLANLIGVSEKTLNNKLNGIRGLDLDTIESVILHFEELSPDWLLTGKGSMLKNTEVVTLQDAPGAGAIPYYSDLPVSTGEKGLASVPTSERPSGWIKIPGVEAELGAFPVVGCSMEPNIHAGDFIAISVVNNWERVDPDKTYLIITLDERMIKHLMIDNEDDNILWCISPNYPKFKIYKSEIQFIYKITFHGKIM